VADGAVAAPVAAVEESESEEDSGVAAGGGLFGFDSSSADVNLTFFTG